MPIYTSYSGELATKLQDYRAKGQKEGSKHRPASDAAGLDAHESALKVEAEGWLNAQQTLFDSTLTDVSRNVVEARQKAIEFGSQVKMLVSDDTLVSSVDSELAGFRQGIVNATQARMRAEADFNYFRASNNVHEEAKYPESVYWHFGIIAILALLETVVNAFFFENSSGLLGGFIVALGIAAINLCFAMGLGVLWRLKNLAAWEMKVAGWSSFVAFVLFSVFCNALFAAFRTQYQMVADTSDFVQLRAAFAQAWPEALLVFRLDPQFQDLWSFILFFVGLLLSCAAFWKGYTVDDRYPGHGEKDRKYKQTLEEEQKQQDLMRQKVKDFLHQRKAAVQAAIQEPGTQVGMLAKRVADLSHARGALEAQADAVSRDYRLVVEAYRHANVAVRSVSAPAYFKDTPVLSTLVDSSGALAVLNELEGVQSALKELGEQYREALHNKLKELQNDSSEILNKVLAQYLEETTKEAEGLIARRTPSIQRVQAA
jgi:hypothetical protein